MTLSITEPTPGVASTLNTTSYAMAAFTPTASSRLIVGVWATATVAVATMTGGGLTWTLDASIAVGGATLYEFFADVGASPASTTITFDCTGDAATGCTMFCLQVTGHDPASPYAQAAATITAGIGNNTVVTWGTALTTTNAYIGFVGSLGGNTTSAPASWTKQDELSYATPTTTGSVLFRINGETGTTINFLQSGTNVNRAAIGIEIKRAPTFDPATFLLPDDAGVSAQWRALLYRRALWARQQAAHHVMPQPERTAVLADVEYSDRVPRSAMRAERQVSTIGIHPVPERQLPLADVVYPAAIDRTALSRQPRLTALHRVDVSVWIPTANPSTVLGARLAHWWAFALAFPGGVSTWHDEVGGQDMVASAGAGAAANTTPANYLAANLGTGDDMATADGSGPPVGTTSFLIAGDYLVTDGNGAIFSSEGAGVTPIGVNISMSAQSLIVIDFVSFHSITGPKFSLGTWHTFVLNVQAAGTATLWVDGVVVGTAVFTTATLLVRMVDFGCSGGSAGIRAQETSLLVGYSSSDFSSGDVIALSAVLQQYIDSGLGASQAIYQDTVQPGLLARQVLVARQMASHHAVPILDRTAPLADVEFPDRVPRALPHASRAPAGGEYPAAPAPVVQQPFVVFPDMVPRARSRLDFFALPPRPEVPVPPTDVRAPDRIPRPLRVQLLEQTPAALPERAVALADVEYPDRVPRPVTRVEQQVFAPELAPGPERTAALSDVEAPDVPPRRPIFPTANQLPALVLPPFPEAPVAKAFASWPDRVLRALPRVEQQPSAAAVPTQPDRPVPAADPAFPDRVSRPAPRAVDQLAMTSLPSRPEAPLSQTTAAWPDRVSRPTFLAAQQPAFAAPSPQPERTFLFFDATGPGRVERPRVAVAMQPAVAPAPIAPERTDLARDVVYPDRVPRQIFSAPQQLAVTELPPQPEAPLPLPSAAHPPHAPRPLQPQHLPFALAPRPEQPLAVADARWPDRVSRPTYWAAQQLGATTEPPVPERTDPAHDPAFPDRVPRPVFPATAQLAAAWVFTSPTERPVPAYDPVFPDRVPRPWVAAAQQLAVTLISPRPEALLPEPAVGWPDRVPRPAFAPAQQRARVAPPEAPERSDPARDPSFPERVLRPVLRVGAQLPATSLPPAPERSLPAVDGAWPDRVFVPIRAYQPPVVALAPTPERTATLADIRHPDRVPPPVPRPEHQPSALAMPLAPERTDPARDAVYPDRVPRAGAVPWQLPATAEPPVPERTMPATDASYPNRVPRPVVRAEVQPHRAAPPEQLERTLAATDPTFPARVERPAFRAAKQPLIAWIFTSPTERPIPAYDPVFPDRISRPIFDARLQMFATSEPPRPEQTSPLADVRHPDRPHRAIVHASCIPYATAVPPQPERPIELESAGYPDRPRRPHLLIAAMPASVVPTQPEQPLPPADVRYPDHLPPRALPGTHLALVRVGEPTSSSWQPTLPDGFPPRRTAPVSGSSFVRIEERVDPFFPSFPDRAPAPLRAFQIAVASIPDRPTDDVSPRLSVALHPHRLPLHGRPSVGFYSFISIVEAPPVQPGGLPVIVDVVVLDACASPGQPISAVAQDQPVIVILTSDVVISFAVVVPGTTQGGSTQGGGTEGGSTG